MVKEIKEKYHNFNYKVTKNHFKGDKFYCNFCEENYATFYTKNNITFCPVCGYHCLGKGGKDCMDKVKQGGK